MGLDTTHNAWHGSYGLFNDFRRELVKAYNGIDLFEFSAYAGIKRDGKTFEDKGYVLADEILEHGLLLLIDHSDCDGEISWHIVA